VQKTQASHQAAQGSTQSARSAAIVTLILRKRAAGVLGSDLRQQSQPAAAH